MFPIRGNYPYCHITHISHFCRPIYGGPNDVKRFHVNGLTLHPRAMEKVSPTCVYLFLFLRVLGKTPSYIHWNLNRFVLDLQTVFALVYPF